VCVCVCVCVCVRVRACVCVRVFARKCSAALRDCRAAMGLTTAVSSSAGDIKYALARTHAHLAHTHTCTHTHTHLHTPAHTHTHTTRARLRTTNTRARGPWPLPDWLQVYAWASADAVRTRVMRISPHRMMHVARQIRYSVVLYLHSIVLRHKGRQRDGESEGIRRGGSTGRTHANGAKNRTIPRPRASNF
jgi:hypothetical protein